MHVDSGAARSLSPSPLDRRLVSERDLADLYRRFPLGPVASVDVVGPFFVVHLDRPTLTTREARVEWLRHTFLPARCEHCRDLLAQGGAFVFEPGSVSERYVPLATGAGREEYCHAA